MSDSGNPFALAKKFELVALGLASHALTGEESTITPLRTLPGGSYVSVLSVPATGVLILMGQPANGETLTINGQVYTFETVFSDTANHVLIGDDEQESLTNLKAAILALTDALGSAVGTGTEAHSDVTAEVEDDSTALLITALEPGTAGNDITLASTIANGYLNGTTLTGGVDGEPIDVAEGWQFSAPAPVWNPAMQALEGARTRQFELAADLLTQEQALAVVAIDRGPWRYMVEFDTEPEGFNQSYIFKVVRREPNDA